MSDDKTSEKSEEKLVYSDDPLLKRIIYILIGSIPILVILGLCVNLIYLDYVKNNYSFFDKSIFISNIDSHVYELRVDCAEAASNKYLPPGQSSNGLAKYNKCFSSDSRAAAKHYCFRYFNDFIFDDNEADILISLAKKAFEYSKPNNDGIITFDIVTGQLSNNGKSINLKTHLENGKSIFSKEEITTFLNLKEKVTNHIRTKFELDNLYLTKPVVFTKLSSHSKTDKIAEYWNDQTDEVTWKPTQYSAILQLNTYIKEFLGGRFSFRNADNRTILSIQPKKARLLVFTSGAENEYYQERMLSDDYFTLKLSFTCDPAHELALKPNQDFLRIADN